MATFPIGQYRPRLAKHAASAVEYVSKAHREIRSNVRLVRRVGSQSFGYALAISEHTDRVGRFVGADIHEAFNSRSDCCRQDVQRSDHVALVSL